jgi:hypothetical protein
MEGHLFGSQVFSDSSREMVRSRLQSRLRCGKILSQINLFANKLMSYSDFTLAQVKKEFDLITIEGGSYLWFCHFGNELEVLKAARKRSRD